MKSKSLLILSPLLLAVACGQGGGSGPSDQSQRPLPIKSCDVVFKKTDSQQEAAVKGDKARNECGLSDEEIEKLLDAAE